MDVIIFKQISSMGAFMQMKQGASFVDPPLHPILNESSKKIEEQNCLKQTTHILFKWKFKLNGTLICWTWSLAKVWTESCIEIYLQILY